MSDYLTNLIGQQRPKNTVPVPTPTPAPKLLPNSLQDAGNELLGNLGIAGRGLVQGAVSPITMVADPLTEFVNKTFGAKQKLPSQAVSEGLTALGVPQAKDDAQRILEAATGGLAGGGAIAKTAQLAGKGAQALKGYLDTIGKDLAGQMTSGLGSGAGSVGASQAATASGASPVVAQLAGLGGGIVGGGARPVGNTTSELNTLKEHLLSKGMKVLDEKAPWYGKVGVSHYFNVETPSGNILPVRASDHGVGDRRAGEAVNYMFGYSDPESFTKNLLDSEKRMINKSIQNKALSEKVKDDFIKMMQNQIDNAPNSKTKKNLSYKLGQYINDYEKSH